MENHEQENLLQPEVTPAEAETQPQEGFYHGAGTGTVEVTGVQEAAQMPASESQPEMEPQKEKKKGQFLWKATKCLICGVLILALVATGCFFSIRSCNAYWKQQYDLLYRNMTDKYDALLSQIEANKPQGEGSGSLEKPALNLTAAQIYQQNVRSVVAIANISKVTQNGQVQQTTSYGTGFIITETGHIVTNHHVVAGATKLVVMLYDGTQVEATLVGSNDSNDVAVIKIDAIGLDPVTLGSSRNLQVGDQVLAIGNALGEFNSSLTVGYVSGINRAVSTDGSVINMIQTDAAINSGNSGGPLFNARGEVIGITTAKYSGISGSGASIEGIGFAVPLDDVIDMIEDLRDYGYIRTTFLGVMVWEVDPAIAATYNLPLGVYVQEVTPGYCADQAGVQMKDIIVELGGYRIRTMNDLSRALRQFEGGTTVTIIVWRAGREIPLSVTLQAKIPN